MISHRVKYTRFQRNKAYRLTNQTQSIPMQLPPKTPMGNYIVIADLPEPQQSALRAWLQGPGLGETQPIIEEEEPLATDCLWYWDYSHWYAH